MVLSFCGPLYCYHLRYLYSFPTVHLETLCFIRAAVSAPGALLSCLSRLDVRAVSLLDVL